MEPNNTNQTSQPQAGVPQNPQPAIAPVPPPVSAPPAGGFQPPPIAPMEQPHALGSTSSPPQPSVPTAPPMATMPLVAPASKEVVKPEGKPKNKQASTQNSLLISEIRDGLVIMRDGSLRAVVMCQSINFDLMSPEEREATEFSYQGFLNSLFFPIQIFIRSQRVDLKSYIEKLEQIHTNQENILLGLLMEDYIAYVRYLIEAANIMDKQFYVVIPYYPPLISGKSGVAVNLQKLTTLVKPAKQTIVINETDFNRYKTELTQQVQVVLNGLQQMNIQSVPLNTQELIELYYNVYNPQTAVAEKLTKVEDLEAPIIGKGQGDAPLVLRGDQ